MKEKAKMYVTFMLGEETCGIDIENVISIEKEQKKTRIPNGPKYVQGVINLRGEVIVIIDLRDRLGMEARESDKDTRILIVSYDEMIIGLRVDSSSEVIEVTKDRIDNPPTSEDDGSYNHIVGVAKTETGLVTILDLAKILEH